MAFYNFNNIAILTFGFITIQLVIAGPIQPKTIETEFQVLVENIQQLGLKTWPIEEKLSEKFYTTIAITHKTAENITEAVLKFYQLLTDEVINELGDLAGACVSDENENVLLANTNLISSVKNCMTAPFEEVKVLTNLGIGIFNFAEMENHQLKTDWASCGDIVPCKQNLIIAGNSISKELSESFLEFQEKAEFFNENGYETMDKCVASSYEKDYVGSLLKIWKNMSECVDGFEGKMNLTRKYLILILRQLKTNVFYRLH